MWTYRLEGGVAAGDRRRGKDEERRTERMGRSMMKMR